MANVYKFTKFNTTETLTFHLLDTTKKVKCKHKNKVCKGEEMNAVLLYMLL